LYELTVTRRAFHGDNDFAVLGRVVEGDYTPPQAIDPVYPDALAEIVARALQVRPDARYPSASALADDLRAFAADRGLALDRRRRAEVMHERFGVEPWPEVDRAMLVPVDAVFGRSRRGSRVLITAALVAAVGAAGFWAGGWMREEPATTAAPASAAPSSMPEPEGVVPADPRAEADVEAGVGDAPRAEPSPPIPEPAAEASPTRTSKPSRKRRARRRASRDGKSRAEASTTGAGGEANELLPPSWHGP
jgi:hypothetical protein